MCNGLYPQACFFGANHIRGKVQVFLILVCDKILELVVSMISFFNSLFMFVLDSNFIYSNIGIIHLL